MSVKATLDRMGGVAALDELIGTGITSRAVQRAASAREVLRIRRGWYASAAADPQVVRAIRVGGSLTCVSGGAHFGIWIPPHEELHVSVTHSARHLKHPETGAVRSADDGVVVHWTASVAPRASRGVLSLLDCLVDALTCQDPDVAFAMLESAVNKKLLSRQDRRTLERRVIRRLRVVLDNVDEMAESGTESLFRFRMLLLGVVMRSQVTIAGVGRVDFLIGDRLVIEIDSTEHHSGRVNRLRDLHRDAILTGLGFICVRFDYQQVLFDWDTVVATVLAVIARGEHLWR